MKLEKDDYLVVSVSGKDKLAILSSVKDDKISVFLDDDFTDADKSNIPIKLDIADIKANLGNNPKYGKAYGVSVEPYKNSIKSEKWGEFFLYRSLSKKEKAVMKESFNKAWKTLNDNNLTAILPMRIDIRMANGKYAGFYKKSKKQDVKDLICFKPQRFDDVEEIASLILHECGHAVYYRMLEDDHKIKWLRLFHKRIVLKELTQEILDDTLKSLTESATTIADYLKNEATSDTTVIVKECVKYCNKVHKLDADDLNLLLLKGKTIEKYWPKHSDISITMADMTEYSMVNAKEFFAEAFCLHLTGKTLPDDVDKNIKKTIKEAAMRNA